MVDVRIEDGNAVFEVLASHKIWALKSQLRIPLSHLRSVVAAPTPPMGWLDGLKLIGTDIPHVFRAGTFSLHGERVFFDVRHPENTVLIELVDEDYKELWVEVEDPVSVVQMLSRAIQP